MFDRMPDQRWQWAAILALPGCLACCGCGPDWWTSQYRDGVSFQGEKSITGVRYDAIIWSRLEAGPNKECPLKIEIDGKTWTAQNLTVEEFPDKSPSKDLTHSLEYRSKRTGARFACSFNHKSKELMRVEIRFERGGKGPVRITLSQGSITLRTSQENLIRQLGEPAAQRHGGNPFM